MCINFPSVLNNLAYVHNAKILLQFHWNLMKRENIQREYKEEMMKNFTDEGDQSFFEALLKKKSAFIISLKAQNLILNGDMVIAFASFTKIKKKNEIGLVIIDYFGCTEVSPKEIIPSFKYERF